MENYHTRLIPLFENLKKTNLKYFLITADFDRIVLMNQFGHVWGSNLKYVKDMRGYLPSSANADSLDAENALILIVNHYFSRGRFNEFEGVIYFVLMGYIKYLKEADDLNDIFQYLVLINYPKDKLSEIVKAYEEKIAQLNAVSENKPTPEDGIETPKEKEGQEEKEETSKEEKISITTDQLKNWEIKISKNQIKIAIKEINDYAIENNLKIIKRELIQLSSRWHSLQEMIIKGTIKLDDKNIEQSKIVDALLNILEKLSDN